LLVSYGKAMVLGIMVLERVKHRPKHACILWIAMVMGYMEKE